MVARAVTELAPMAKHRRLVVPIADVPRDTAVKTARVFRDPCAAMAQRRATKRAMAMISRANHVPPLAFKAVR